MSRRLEQFVNNHRSAFDTEEPGKEVWEKINPQPAPSGKARRIYLTANHTRAAAALLFLLLSGAMGYWLFHHPSLKPGPSASNPPAVVQSLSATPDVDQPASANHQDSSLASSPGPAGDRAVAANSLHPSEMDQYGRLVALKEKQMELIRDQDPQLYGKFKTDLHKLDSVYNILQRQLSPAPNSDQIVEAMLQDLQLQMKLLNHQLGIIQQINHLKKVKNDTSYKSL